MIQAQGAIAEARTSGPLPTPVEGFALDLAALDRLAERLREQAEDDDRSVDSEP